MLEFWLAGIIPAFIYFYIVANDFAKIKVTPLFIFYVFIWPITVILVVILYLYVTIGSYTEK